MTIQGFHDPERKPWVIKLVQETGYGSFEVEATYTPEAPGPFVGTWELSWLVNGECEHGELYLTLDPGWPPDSRVLMIWEQPDTTQYPDFIGTVGLIRGATTPSEADYTLPVLGLGDIDVQGRAGTYSYFDLPGVTVGGGITYLGVGALETKRGETVQAHHARILEPYPDGSSGVRSDGVRVIGRATAGIYSLSAALAYDLTLSGYERQKYVTETDADLGPEWALLSTSRGRPTSLTPRVLAASATGKNAEAGTVALIQPDVETLPPLAWQTNFFPINLTIEKDYYAAAAEVTGDFPSQQTDETILAFSIPLSDLMAGSSSRKNAVDATYTLKALSSIIGASLIFAQYDTGGLLYADANIDSSYYNTTELSGGLEVTARHWVSGVADTYDPEAALSTVIIARADFKGGRDFFAEAQDWAVQLVPEPDFLSDLYTSLNGGMYWWKVALRVKTTSFTYQYTRKADADPTQPQRGWEKAVWTAGRWKVIAKVDMPKLVQDVLSGAIPTQNLPDGYFSGTTSPPTAQGKVPGRLNGPAELTGIVLADGSLVAQVITQYRLQRSAAEYATSFQTGARQTRVLTTAEANLQEARQRRLLTALGQGPL